MPTAEELQDEKDALALLSPEERAAMQDDEEQEIAAELGKDADDNDDEQTSAEKADAVDDEDEDEDEDDETDSNLSADDSARTAKQADAEPADNVVDANPVPLDLAPVEQGYQAQLKALNEEKAKNFKALMDGEIEAEEYSARESKYLSDRDALAEEKSGQTAWFKEVHSFKTDATKDGVDYHRNPEHADSLNDWVKRLASNPKNADKEGSWFLQEAHKKVLVEFGVDAPAANDAKSKQLPQKNVAKPNGRAPKLDKIPPTLGNLPAAGESEAGDDGEFAHLDKLGGMELERAYAKMTPEQQERYLRE